MKILADENIERPIINKLRETAYDVVSIAETQLGVADPVSFRPPFSCK